MRNNYAERMEGKSTVAAPGRPTPALTRGLARATAANDTRRQPLLKPGLY